MGRDLFIKVECFVRALFIVLIFYTMQHIGLCLILNKMKFS